LVEAETTTRSYATDDRHAERSRAALPPCW
jgi:hypothetical protein